MSVFDFAWAPDGKAIALFTASEPGLGPGYWQADLQILTLADGKLKTLAAGCGSSKLLFSDDGERIAFLTPPGARVHRPAVIARTGGPVHEPGKNLEFTVWDFVWRADGKELICWGHQGLEGFVGTLPARPSKTAGRLKVWYPLALHAWGVPALSRSRDGRWLALLAESTRHPAEIHVASVTAHPLPPRRLSHHHAGLEKLQLGKVERRHWKAADGLVMEGVLVHPPQPPEGPSPTVLMIHGGPQWQWWRGWLGSWHEPAQLLAAQGYRVLLPNPRGSTGRGDAFAAAARADWGGADYQDLMAGMDSLIDDGLADPEHLAVVGWSYGGYMTSWIVTRTPRFKAAVAGALVSNLLSMHGTSDIPPFLPDQFRVQPYQEPRTLRERSPVFFASRVQTPILVVHGEADVRVPLGQAREWVQALKDAGAPVRFVTYPGEGHHFRQAQHLRHLMKEMLAWLKSRI